MSGGIDMYDGICKETMIGEYFGCSIDDIAEVVIVSPILDIKRFKSYSDKTVSEFSGWYKGVTVEHNKRLITIISSGIGSPLTGDCVLALQYSRCKKVIFSGSAGAINKEYKIGDIIAAGEAVIGEGFSRYHYDNIEHDCFGKLVYGDMEMTQKLAAHIKKYEAVYNINTYTGRVFTIDSILGESREMFEYMKQKSCDVVEMEVSSVFTACRRIEKSAAALIFISDLPLQRKSLFEGRNIAERELYKRQTAEIPRILLEIAAQI